MLHMYGQRLLLIQEHYRVEYPMPQLKEAMMVLALP